MWKNLRPLVQGCDLYFVSVRYLVTSGDCYCGRHCKVCTFSHLDSSFFKSAWREKMKDSWNCSSRASSSLPCVCPKEPSCCFCDLRLERLQPCRPRVNAQSARPPSGIACSQASHFRKPGHLKCRSDLCSSSTHAAR